MVVAIFLHAAHRTGLDPMTSTTELTDESAVDIAETCESLVECLERDDSESQVTDEVTRRLENLHAADQARILDRLPLENRERLFSLLDPELAADVVENLSEGQAAAIVGDLSPGVAADVCEQMHSETRADVLGDLDPADAKAVIAEMQPVEAEQARRLTQYADDVAGGLMATEFLSVASDATVGQVIDKLTDGADEYRDFDVQYVYVTDAEQRLVGVLPLREIVLSKRTRAVSDVMIGSPLALADTTDLDHLEDFFDDHAFFGVPIVNAAGALLGIVRRSSVEQALANLADDRYRKSQGLVAEELRSMPLFLRSRRRLAWLSANILLNAIAASVIIAFEGTLKQVIALAVFLPIISDMSGCSGGQAVAVTMRELSLGLARPADLLRVWRKEAAVGVINGICLGLLLGLGGFLMYDNLWLGAVVGTALCVNTLVAVSIGGCIPLVLKRFNFDPAVASGPLLTTVTDMCGFFIVLGLATAFLAKLVG